MGVLLSILDLAAAVFGVVLLLGSLRLPVLRKGDVPMEPPEPTAGLRLALMAQSAL